VCRYLPLTKHMSDESGRSDQDGKQGPSFPAAGLREDQIVNAVAFLSHPKVRLADHQLLTCLGRICNFSRLTTFCIYFFRFGVAHLHRNDHFWNKKD
jgi:hypothetical protein